MRCLTGASLIKLLDLFSYFRYLQNRMKIVKKNRKSGDCGVVAAFNASSWCNMDRPYKEVDRIARSCGYHPRKGIRDFQFVNLANKLGLPYRRVRQMKLDEIESGLYLGKCFVLLYFPRQYPTGHVTGHVITVYMSNDRIKIINPDDVRITWSEFASDYYAKGMRELIAYELPARNV
jgi:hypothetical protein